MADVAFVNYRLRSAGPTPDPRTTAANRTMPDRLGIDVINVQDWGADPTGVSDSATPINSAIQLAYRSNPASRGGFTQGATVFIPRGTYLLNSQVVLNNNTTIGNSSLQIIGAGRDATILKGSFSGALVVLAMPGALATIRDLT